MPTLRERKRYLAFEIISKERLSGEKAVSSAFTKSTLQLLGELGTSEAGLKFMRYDTESQRGLVKVSHKSLDKLRASLSIITQIEGQEVIVQTLGASGTIKKAANYIAG